MPCCASLPSVPDFPAGIELISAFYGCLYSGCVPVTVRPPHAQSLVATLPTVRMIVEVSARGRAWGLQGGHLCHREWGWGGDRLQR